MRAASILSSLLAEEGRRLGASAFVDGSIATRKRIQELPHRRLRDVTAGFKGGIFTHLFSPKRTYVSSREYGVPFLGASSMLLADLSGLPLISKKDADSRSYRPLAIREGMTLISCSGSVGRMVYARSEMNGMISAGDIMKVQPDPAAIHSGYLFAFLSSRFGRLLVNAGMYGTIVQHLEPQHIAHLPVPRLGEEVERSAHDLVDGAAKARSKAADLKRQARQLLLERLGLEDISDRDTPTSFATFIVASGELARLDAAYHSPASRLAAQQLAESASETRAVADLGRVFTPGIFKRPYVENHSSGYPYFSGTELFQNGAVPRGYLARKWTGIEEYRVAQDWLLIQDAGQLGGLIGRVVRIPPTVAGGVVSNHLMRIAIEDRHCAAFLFAVLTSGHGYRAIVRNAFGSSIPQLDPKHVGAIQVPWPDRRVRAAVAKPVLRSWQLEDEAIVSERSAVALVERAIEEAA